MTPATEKTVARSVRASSPSRSDVVVVLMYHRVGEAMNAWEARYAIRPARFEAHMLALRRSGFQAVPLEMLLHWLDGGPELPAGAFVLTFDDGFRGVREHALPVLERLHWPSTVFLVSDLLGGSDRWTTAANPDGRTHALLDVDEVLDMQARGVAIHSHTCSHPSLPSLGDPELRHELAHSRVTLESLLGRTVDCLAYPFGHVDDRVVHAARGAGYRAAFSTRPGFNRRDADRFRIRRIDVYGTDSASMLMRKIRLGTDDGTLTGFARYYAARAWARLRPTQP